MTMFCPVFASTLGNKPKQHAARAKWRKRRRPHSSGTINATTQGLPLMATKLSMPLQVNVKRERIHPRVVTVARRQCSAIKQWHCFVNNPEEDNEKHFSQMH